MVGELARLFLREKPSKVNDSDKLEEEAGYEMAQGIWEGWEAEDEIPEDEDLDDDRDWVEEVEEPVVRPVINKEDRSKRSSRLADAERSKQSEPVDQSLRQGRPKHESIQPDESFGDR